MSVDQASFAAALLDGQAPVPAGLQDGRGAPAGYDPSALSSWHYLVVLAGTWAEILLPVFIVIGLFTRLSALAMIGFIAVQSLTDLYGHRLIDEPKAVGAWFDIDSASLLMDQRLLWVMLLLILVFKGAGPLSLDRLLAARRSG